MSGSRRSKSCRQRWKFSGSLRWPHSWSVSTRLTKTRPSSTFSRSSIVRLIPSTFDFVGNDSSMSQPAKMSRDLPDAVRRVARVADRREVVRAARLEREVVAVRRALVVAGLADERTCDHAADRVLAREDLARDAAARVELLERDRLLVRGDLEDGVGGRVDDPLAGALVLLAELLDDLRARRRLVADHPAARAVHERVDHLVGEPVRIGRERRRRDDAHQLPVACRGVLALRALEEPARDGRRVRLRRAALELLDVAEAERLEVRAGRARRPPGDVPERVRAVVAVVGGVRQLAGADGIEHDHTGTGHAELS